MAGFGFFRKNGKANENAFLNRLLPNMILFRDFKKGELRKFLDRNIKAYLPEKVQMTVLDFLTDSFDFSYFDDSFDFENDVRLNWRIHKENLPLLINLFMKLNIAGMKRSGYLRTLINEYANMPDFKRERVLYRVEYNIVDSAMREQMPISFYFEKEKMTVCPLVLEYTYIDGGGWYIVGLDSTKENILRSIPLSSAECLMANPYLSFPDISKLILEKTKQIVDRGDFAKQNMFLL